MTINTGGADKQRAMAKQGHITVSLHRGKSPGHAGLD